jgi:hypothetical protein
MSPLPQGWPNDTAGHRRVPLGRNRPTNWHSQFYDLEIKPIANTPINSAYRWKWKWIDDPSWRPWNMKENHGKHSRLFTDPQEAELKEEILSESVAPRNLFTSVTCKAIAIQFWTAAPSIARPRSSGTRGLEGSALGSFRLGTQINISAGSGGFRGNQSDLSEEIRSSASGITERPSDKIRRDRNFA